jgi:hypothetical protein
MIVGQSGEHTPQAGESRYLPRFAAPEMPGFESAWVMRGE